MRFHGLEVVGSRGLLVLGVGLVLVVVEEGLDEEGAPCTALVLPFPRLRGGR